MDIIGPMLKANKRLGISAGAANLKRVKFCNFFKIVL